MKLLTFEPAGRPRFGALIGDGVLDLTHRLGGGITTLRAALEADALGRIEEIVARAKPDHALAGLKLVSPIPFPEKIICVGVNYGNRNAECKDGSAESEQLDYEGEIGIVIGRGGRRIPEDQAESHIAGLTCVNEGTIRDWTRHADRCGHPLHSAQVPQARRCGGSRSLGCGRAVEYRNGRNAISAVENSKREANKD